MKTTVGESVGRRVSRNTGHLILVSLLPYMLSVQYAAALTLNEAAPDELPATGYRGFTEESSIKASARGQPADEKKLVWSFHAGYMLVVGMGNSDDPDRLPQIFFEHGPQMYLVRGRVPHISVRIKRKF